VDAVVRQADVLGLLSDEHFTLDSTPIDAAASLKSFKAKDKPSDEPPMIAATRRSTSEARSARTPRRSTFN
jgi:hypothetical protein